MVKPVANRDSLLQIGLYGWGEFTTRIAQIQAQNLEYARLGGTPTDAEMTVFVNQDIEVMWSADNQHPRSFYASDALFIADYLAYLDTNLGKYGPLGTFWIANPALKYNPIAQVAIINEPNFNFTGTTSQKADLYARLLVAAYDHIKTNWPGLIVLGLNSASSSHVAPGWVTAVLTVLQTLGRLDCFDVMSLHMYSFNLPPEYAITEGWGSWVAATDVQTVHQSMLSYGVDKPLWLTETGYWISNTSGGRYTPGGGSGQAATTLVQQAAYYLRMSMVAARYGVQRFYCMNIVDTDNVNMGWFDRTGVARPVATAMRQLMLLLNGASRVEVLLDGTSSPVNPFAYRFTTPSGRVIVAWCQAGSTTSLPLDGVPTTVVDQLGNVIANTTGDSYSATLSETPIFLHPTIQGIQGIGVVDGGSAASPARYIPK